jgi:hypothetical protein
MKCLGFVLLILSGYVMAEEVYYCSSSAVGYAEENGNYEPGYFSPIKFNMKLQDDGNITIENSNLRNDNDLYLCSNYENSGACYTHKRHDGSHFIFNQDDGNYSWFKGFSYDLNDEDSSSSSMGTCTKF